MFSCKSYFTTTNPEQRMWGIAKLVAFKCFIDCFPLFKWSFVLDLFLQRDPRGRSPWLCVSTHLLKSHFLDSFLGSSQTVCSHRLFLGKLWSDFFAQNIIIFLAAFRPVKCLVITCWSFAIKTHLNAAVNTQLIVSCQLHAFKAIFFFLTPVSFCLISLSWLVILLLLLI